MEFWGQCYLWVIIYSYIGHNGWWALCTLALIPYILSSPSLATGGAQIAQPCTLANTNIFTLPYFIGALLAHKEEMLGCHIITSILLSNKCHLLFSSTHEGRVRLWGVEHQHQSHLLSYSG